MKRSSVMCVATDMLRRTPISEEAGSRPDLPENQDLICLLALQTLAAAESGGHGVYSKAPCAHLYF